MLRRINISAALIVFVCFFLPWEQVSCGGAKDTLNGLDLARHDHPLLWLVPLLMLAVTVAPGAGVVGVTVIAGDEPPACTDTGPLVARTVYVSFARNRNV